MPASARPVSATNNIVKDSYCLFHPSGLHCSSAENVPVTFLKLLLAARARVCTLQRTRAAVSPFFIDKE